MCTLLMVVFPPKLYAQEGKSATFPGFRHVDAASNPLEPSSGNSVVLVADQDFAPWSFLSADGQLQGIAVDIVLKACVEAGFSCEIKHRAFSEIISSVERGEAQGIVSGPKLDFGIAEKFALTRPYFQTLGRFAVRTGSPLAATDVRTLAGRRIGHVENSAHARFLENHYGRSALVSFTSSDAMLEALRTGQVDAVFGDAIQLSYWLQGNASRGCCNFLGKAFVDRTTFTRSLSLALLRGEPQLRSKFDAALDRLESNGATAEIFARYLPSSLW